MPTAKTIALARSLREVLAGAALLPEQAKLYSQRVRRDMGADGLSSFRAAELTNRLDEAMLLLEAAWIERSADSQSPWHRSVKRAAELLEWISQASLKPEGAPIHLLSAAAYQVAGYPAMALGQLRRMPEGEAFSTMLREFLRADFDAVLRAVETFWIREHERDSGVELWRVAAVDDEGGSAPPSASTLEVATVRHVVMAIGTVCGFLKIGDKVLVERAIAKLEALAKIYLHSRDAYSYLLARLTAEAARQFVDASLWPHVKQLSVDASDEARAALVQFARAAFVNKRALVWPAQREGIERLAAKTSFVLCTPTGSGKTTVAVLAAVQGLFAAPKDPLAGGNLVLYLVPSRALAAEVESRFADDLRGISADPVVVTGLYGGADWGPTDAWVQIDEPTVVICTFEKADALLRYLGTLFLDRVRLVVIDEAHMVEQDPTRAEGIYDGTSRALRLEQLAARLLNAQAEKSFRLIALSAVAAKAGPALAGWLGGEKERPITSTHRSTRQMLGRLEVRPAGRFDIRYDLMDGHALEFEDERTDDRPFVPSPFPPLPGGVNAALGPEVSIRAPTLWAALHLAALRPDGSRPAVMISLTQKVSPFAGFCADLLDAWAKKEDLPDYWSVDPEDPHWLKCLAAAADYFTTESYEYRLLARGVAVHHGQLPGLLARRLKIAIDRGQVRVIIATSTLSEGVNIPVNTLLIPSVHRATDVMPVSEFSNLIGRAGRPGVATEGSVLVVLPERTYRTKGGRRVPSYNRTWDGYEELVGSLQKAATRAAAGDQSLEDGEAHSALAMLLERLREAWEELTGDDEDGAFVEWLEATAVGEGPQDGEAGETEALLDTLDGLLIAAIQEVEQLRAGDLTAAALEEALLSLWRRTYAFVASEEEDRLSRIWLGRGRAIVTLYPDPVRRRQLYKTSLPPRSGRILLDTADELRAALAVGRDYATWEPEARFEFVCAVVRRLGTVPAFRISTKLGLMRKPFTDWEKLLRWWLWKSSLKTQPAPKDLGVWFSFVSENFIYRGNWGLGSLVGVLLDRGDEEGPVDALTIDDWPRSGLPWIAFWLKELITWGTLDPVAAFLLARGDVLDRPQAEAQAQLYYAEIEEGADANETLNPRHIRDWLETRRAAPPRRDRTPDLAIDVTLERSSTLYVSQALSVFPLVSGRQLRWINPAGYVVARSDIPVDWPTNAGDYRFELRVDTRLVSGEAYQPHIAS